MFKVKHWKHQNDVRPATLLKETPTHVFSCEYCKKFYKHLLWRTFASGYVCYEAWPKIISYFHKIFPGKTTDGILNTPVVENPVVENLEAPLQVCSQRKVFCIYATNFTGEHPHPYRSVVSIKYQSNFIEITPRHGCSSVNLLHIFRAPFLGTPLTICIWKFCTQ